MAVLAIRSVPEDVHRALRVKDLKALRPTERPHRTSRSAGAPMVAAEPLHRSGSR